MVSGESAQLRRQLGFGALVAYGLAYVAPIAPLSTLGLVWEASDGLIALSYLLGGICMAFTAFSYSAMVREVRSAGSIYGFANEVLGPFAGFVAGWLILLDYLLIPAFVFVVMAIALGQLLPQVDRSIWIVILVGATFAINWFGVRATARVSLGTVIAQVAVVVAILAVALVWVAQGHGSIGVDPIYRSPLNLSAVLAGTSICVMSFLGFDAVSTLAEDAKDDSGKTLSKAILAVLGLATGFFVVAAYILGAAMAGFTFKSLDAAAYELVGAMAGNWAALALAWFYAIVVGFTNALPMQVGVARVLYAMGRDRQLPAILGKLHPRHNTPHIAMIVSTVVSLTVALWMQDNLDRLATFVNFGALAGFAILHLCVLRHFSRKVDGRHWGRHILMPVLGVLILLAILVAMNRHALILGAAWLMIGIIVYIARMRITGPDHAAAQH